jgi:predicted aldo/keto reductase-like oxidoreductase
VDYKKIEKASANVSRLGFGAMRLPLLDDSDKTSVDFELAQKMVDTAIAGGVNYFDTAYVYHGQTSEGTLAKLLANYPRESYYLADKYPLMISDTAKEVDEIFQRQLGRCNTEYFDFFLLHACSACGSKS